LAQALDGSISCLPPSVQPEVVSAPLIPEYSMVGGWVGGWVGVCVCVCVCVCVFKTFVMLLRYISKQIRAKWGDRWRVQIKEDRPCVCIY
jgi:hypothetical protein